MQVLKLSRSTVYHAMLICWMECLEMMP